MIVTAPESVTWDAKPHIGTDILVDVVRQIREFEGFAESVAKGHLDVQLPRHRINLFGNFTESFDIMREELRNAREREVQANKAKREMVLGDARKRLEDEDRRGDEKYDILVMDAFSGDSISMYLVSQEAFSLYRRRLKDDGTFAVNITNWNLDLLPVMKAAAKELGMTCDVAEQPPGLFTYTARWALMSRERPKFPEGARFIRLDSVADAKLPTDERGSLVPYLLLLH